MSSSGLGALYGLLGCLSALTRPLLAPILGDSSILIPPAFALLLRTVTQPFGLPFPPMEVAGLLVLWEFGGLREDEAHKRSCLTVLCRPQRGENQMVPCFLQACSSLLGGYSSWDERSILLDKEKGLSFLFSLRCSAVCWSYFYSFLHPRDGMRQSMGCFHGLVSEEGFAEVEEMGYY